MACVAGLVFLICVCVPSEFAAPVSGCLCMPNHSVCIPSATHLCCHTYAGALGNCIASYLSFLHSRTIAVSSLQELFLQPTSEPHEHGTSGQPVLPLPAISAHSVDGCMAPCDTSVLQNAGSMHVGTRRARKHVKACNTPLKKTPPKTASL